MDQLFSQFTRGLFTVMVMFGAGMLIVILFGDPTIGYRMANIFGSMFLAVLGLGSGYLLGRSDRRLPDNGKEDTHDRT